MAGCQRGGGDFQVPEIRARKSDEISVGWAARGASCIRYASPRSGRQDDLDETLVLAIAIRRSIVEIIGVTICRQTGWRRIRYLDSTRCRRPRCTNRAQIAEIANGNFSQYTMARREGSDSSGSRLP